MARRTPIHSGQVAFACACGLILAFLAVPTLLVIPMSFSASSYLRLPPSALSLRWYQAYLSDPDWRDATIFSLKIATLTALLSTAIGACAALALVRGTMRAKAVITGLITAPLVVPHIVLAVGIYAQFVTLKLTGTTIGFVLAHSALAAPYVVLMVTAALSRVDVSLDMAALSLGASRFRCFFEVTLPIIAPAIWTGAIFAFLASFDETVVSFFISGTENKTLTRKLFEDIDFNLSPIIAAISTLVVVMTLLVLGLAHLAKTRLERRRLGTEHT